jgi:arginyl-tRNA synthetase
MKEIISNILKKELKGKLTGEEIENLLEIPKSPELGDFAFPCFRLSSLLKKNPVQIAQEIEKKLKLPKEIDKVKATGPYLNFFVNRNNLVESIINQILKEKENYGKAKGNEKIVIDFSGPNIGKPMHIGHIRSTIIGDSMMRVNEFLGNQVTGINYLGDTGLHIGKLIVAYELWLDKKALAKDPVAELLRLYIKFNELEGSGYEEGVEEEERDNEWTNKAKDKLKLLEMGDKNAHKIWQEIQTSSKKGFDRVYKMLDVNFHETTGQSLFSEKGKQIIAEALKKKLASKEADGAVFVEFENLPKKYILRSNGTASYMTQDIGAAVTRYDKYKFDKMIYVTDFRQSLHFKHLFTILDKFGFKFSSKLEHLPFGTVNFGNEIMATRKGKVILLEDVLKKTIEKADEEIKKRKTKGDAEIIGVGSVKYAILKNSPQQDVHFSWEQALSFEGNTGPYLQYSYARASSILRKAKKGKVKIEKLEDSELKLIKKLGNFPGVVLQAGEHLNPSLIANYSFELSQIFNEFYHASQVIGSKEEAFRLSLVEAFRIIIKQSLYLLGIDVMEEM